jgi:hypothetical protein
LGRLDVLLGGGLLATLLGAPHWLIFLDTLSRAWTTYDRPAAELGTPAHAVAFVLGTLAPGRPFTGGHPLLVVCAACALSHPRGLRRSPLAAGALASLLTAIALTFGVIPPALLARIPLVAHIHHIWDTFLTAAVPPLLVLAGVGVAALVEDRKRGGLASTALALLAAVACAWAVPGVLPNTATELGWLAVGGAALAVLALRWSGRVQPLLLAVGTAAAIAAGGLHLETGIAEVDALLIQPRHRAMLTTLSPAIAAAKNVTTADPFRVVPVESVLFPGTQAYWRLEGQGGPDALRLPELDVLAEEGGLERTTWLWLFVLHQPAVTGASRLLDMLNVRYLVARPEHVPPGAVLLPVEDADRIRVIVRDSAWPRAFFTGSVRHHRRVSDFVRLLRESDGPFASVDERDFEATAAVAELPATGGTIPASDYVLTTNTTTFRVSSPSRGLAVLGESYVEKDFEATLNGRPVPYIRVNHGFKAVVIPGAGDWTVTFRYRPALWECSWALAGLGATGAGGVVFMARRRARSRAPSVIRDHHS